MGRSQNYVAMRLRKEAAFTLTDIEAIATIIGMGYRELIASAGGDQVE
jgi:hypothetical protein